MYVPKNFAELEARIADEMMVYLALGKTGRQRKPRDLYSAAKFLRDIWMIHSYRLHLMKLRISCIGRDKKACSVCERPSPHACSVLNKAQKWLVTGRRYPAIIPSSLFLLSIEYILPRDFN
jgi:hypothetical protein